jgi:lipopolysaccharide/colanic/teichoic acid biosynthesis glycosyltransferase
MVRGVRYRVVSAAGTLVAAAGAVLVANSLPVQAAVTTYVPLVNRLDPTVLAGEDLFITLGVATLTVLLASFPLLKPQPRRILDTAFLSQRQVVLATLALATLGYFDYDYRLPRATLLASMTLLLVVLPLWFVYIRRTGGAGDRTLVVGDDATEIRRVLAAIEGTVLGYVAPPGNDLVAGLPDEVEPPMADGGVAGVAHLGGLSRLEDVLVDEDVETVVLAFDQPDREEFFGALAHCHDHGVAVKMHRRKADGVLVEPDPGAELVDVDLEPWDWQDRAVKRLFDLAFAWFGLVLLSPVMTVVGLLVRLDSPGPVLYSQERTAEFGDTFTVYKFRTMVAGAEAETGATVSAEDRGDEDPRVTRFGRLLRRTHLDEIPQLWSVLVGDMSVVGPRPERPEIEGEIETGIVQWRRRWFVRPGLTGLAQINGVTGHEPARKLRYDVEYIRRQSFRFDVAILIRQLWMVVMDGWALVRPDD